MPNVKEAKIWSWIDSETPEFVDLVGQLIASLPGAPAELEQEGYESIPMGWTEAELLVDLLSRINDENDVQEAASLFLESATATSDEDADDIGDDEVEIRIRPNVEQGFYDRQGRFHPIRSSIDYDPEEVGEPEHWSYATPPRTRRGPSPLLARKRTRRTAARRRKN